MPAYCAVKTLLEEGADDKHDRRIVRALLDTVSLFPIGSRVELCSGAKARVLRAIPGRHTRPLVEELDENGSPTGQILDLSAPDMPQVVAIA